MILAGTGESMVLSGLTEGRDSAKEVKCYAVLNVETDEFKDVT